MDYNNLDYDLEIDKLKNFIKKSKCKTVILQFPDGLKPLSGKVCDEIEKLNVQPIIWFGTCYGSCDIPLGLDLIKADLFVQWGHNNFSRVKGWK